MNLKTLVTETCLLLFACAAVALPAAPVKLEWGASVSPDVVGYALYGGPIGSPFTIRIDAGLTTSASIAGLTVGAEYVFGVVAYDLNGNESDLSNLVTFTPEAVEFLKLRQLADGSMNITFSVAPNEACSVEYTDALSPANWQTLTSLIADNSGAAIANEPGQAPQRFFRVSIP